MNNKQNNTKSYQYFSFIAFTERHSAREEDEGQDS